MNESTPLDLSAMSPVINWDTIIQKKTTIPTLQVVVNPKLRRGSSIHQRVFEELQNLGADYVRFVPWFPYPHDSIAEMYPPADGKTSWNCSSIDPFTIDFLEATKSHPVMLNFSTIPPWMFKADHMVPYPDDPDQPIWHYQVGTELRDPTMKEIADYFARLVSWYTKGGFTDETGIWHESGHHYALAYWEVLNEPDLEHDTSPEQYTARYDAIVSAIRKIDPEIKFVGMSLAMPGRNPEFFEYFLNPKNHQPGIPLDMISYHFYASPAGDEKIDIEQYTYFAQADGFLNTVRFIESIRKRLSPTTQTTINEIGVIRADDMLQFTPGHVAQPIPDAYWNLAGAVYAYIYANLAVMGIDIAGESQLVGYPSQFPSVSMVDWNTGAPNARLRVLELIKNHITPNDHVVHTTAGAMGSSPYYLAQAFIGPDGSRKLLLVNKRDRVINLTLPGFSGATVSVVDKSTAGGRERLEKVDGESYCLPGFAVAIVTIG